VLLQAVKLALDDGLDIRLEVYGPALNADERAHRVELEQQVTLLELDRRVKLGHAVLRSEVPELIILILGLFVYINLVLMIFNLLPIPPLDGSKVLFAFLPPRLAWQWRPVLEQYGFILLLLLFFLPPGNSIGGQILGPILNAIFRLLVGG